MSKKSKNRDLGRNDQPQAVDEPQVNTSALEASQAFVESAEVLNKGAGSTLEDAFAPDQTVRSAPPSAAGASGSPGASDAAPAAAEHAPEGTTPQEATPQGTTPREATPRVGTSDSGEAILHSTRALEDDPAMKAAQVLALDNAAEQAEREALEEAAEAEELRKTTTENLKMPPPKPVDNPEDLKTAGQVLRYHRQRMGLSIKQVADQLKARATTIADIEADRLNAPSVVKMVSRQVSSYAILLNLDAEEVVRLYRQNIKENVTIEHVEVRPKSDGRMNRIWLLVVLMILVATAGYFVFGGENKDDAPKSGALKDPALTTVHDTATALVTSDSKLTVGEPVVIETEPGRVYELINPEIIARKGRQEEPEGCLSLPGESGITRRPMTVTVRAQDRTGKEFELTGSGLLARAICHETDHLDGHLFTEVVIRPLGEEDAGKDGDDA